MFVRYWLGVCVLVRVGDGVLDVDEPFVADGERVIDGVHVPEAVRSTVSWYTAQRTVSTDRSVGEAPRLLRTRLRRLYGDQYDAGMETASMTPRETYRRVDVSDRHKPA